MAALCRCLLCRLCRSAYRVTPCRRSCFGPASVLLRPLARCLSIIWVRPQRRQRRQRRTAQPSGGAGAQRGRVGSGLGSAWARPLCLPGSAQSSGGCGPSSVRTGPCGVDRGGGLTFGGKGSGARPVPVTRANLHPARVKVAYVPSSNTADPTFFSGRIQRPALVARTRGAGVACGKPAAGRAGPGPSLTPCDALPLQWLALSPRAVCAARSVRTPAGGSSNSPVRPVGPRAVGLTEPNYKQPAPI